MAQLPEEAVGTFAGILIYSLICLFSSLLVIWLTFRHREWTSYVACLGYFTSLATICSIIQQIHVMMFWDDLMEERFYYARAHSDSPELTLTGISLGLDRVLFYIQYYCYHVEGLIVMFWGLQLVQSLYRLNENPKLRRVLIILNRGGKVFAILFPVVIIGSLQGLLATRNYAVFDRLARQPLMWSVGIGCVTIIAILFRYIQSRMRLQKFNVTYANSQSLGTQNDTAGDTPASLNRKPVISKKNIYDRWLVTRFTIAFFILSLFELSIVLFSRAVRSTLDTEHANDKPDLSPERAVNDFRFFAPGVTASLLTFLVFGTTKPFIKYMRGCIVGPPEQNTSIVEYNGEPSSGYTHTSKPSLMKGGIELVAPTRAYYTNMRD